MKILITSYAYAPSVGGIETVTDLLAPAFAAEGHEVRIVTDTPDPENQPTIFPVLRQPGKTVLIDAVKWADVVWQNNVALNYLWAPLLLGKPTAVTLQCAIYPEFPKKNWKVRMKAFLVQRCRIFAISRYVMNDMKSPFELIGNPFDAGFAQSVADVEKTKDIVFAGRLVSDKGVDLLIDALASLRGAGKTPSCTIIGDGDERSQLEAQVESLGLSDQVAFVGFQKGEALHRIMASHRIMAVPSRWLEPFGIVALEGIAAGCAVVGSEGGGLGEAIGPCGLTFPNNDGAALTAQLDRVLSEPELIETFQSKAAAHLDRFSVKTQSQRYLNTFETMLSA
ncbi:MAG: glycosyltransferase family 4 protein [Verrucomicrobiota bacterium]